MMLRICVKFLDTVKNTVAFTFYLEILILRISPHNDKVVAQCFGNWRYFAACTKISTNPTKAVILRHRMGRMRAARLTNNMTLLLNTNT